MRRSLQLIKRTAIEQGVAKNQLLPALGLSLTLSNTGLRGNRGLASALDDQWNFGDPTYGIGLEYALPFGNRAAKANLRQAELRVRQFQKEFELVLSDVALEIRNAVHNVTLTGKQRKTTSHALSLAKRELEILERRAELLIDGNEVGPLYLENVLQAQDRLATAELGYLNSSAGYALANFELQRANGGLLRCSPLPAEAAPTDTWEHRLAGHPTPLNAAAQGGNHLQGSAPAQGGSEYILVPEPPATSVPNHPLQTPFPLVPDRPMGPETVAPAPVPPPVGQSPVIFHAPPNAASTHPTMMSHPSAVAQTPGQPTR